MHPHLNLIVALIGISGTFLPWADVPRIGSVNGMEVGGKLTIAFFGLAAVLIFIGKLRLQIAWGFLLPIMLLAAGAAAVAGHKIYTFYRDMKGQSNPLSSMVSLGIGLFLIAAAGLGIIALALILKGSVYGPQS